MLRIYTNLEKIKMNKILESKIWKHSISNQKIAKHSKYKNTEFSLKKTFVSYFQLYSIAYYILFFYH